MIVSTRVGEDAREESELLILVCEGVKVLEGLGDESLVVGRRGFLYMSSSSRSGVIVKFFEQFWGVQVFVINPRVFRRRVALPMHEVLERFASPLPPGVAY